MRKLLMLLLAGTIISGCNNDKNASEKTESSAKEETVESTVPAVQETTPVATPVPAPGPLDKFLGSFVGPFGDNKITMLITKVSGDSVVGRTIVGGNDRPFRGTFSKSGENYAFNAKEPGDHKDDGEFNFTISETNPAVVQGSWKPFATAKPAKQYELQRRAFSYRPDVGDYPESSTRLLKVEDVENLIGADLEFMRNEIFARHGFCFNKKHLRQQFEMKDWYIPNTVNIKGFLTDVEKKNIALIKRYEKYAEQYGDEYGR
ncbi:MAG: YARHG domain-containing protein [Ferruginibacter sp.]|nr:YARHG domain-containing protein [Chitinophagaceae bacterium]